MLKKLWPAPFSIEQRYRYYPNARVVESISKEKEARLMADGCTDELRGTIKPDLVLHENLSLLLKSVLTLDFKFPCPDTIHSADPHSPAGEQRSIGRMGALLREAGG